MIFGEVALDASAQGALLAHTHQLPGLVLRKGVPLSAGDIALLRDAGHTTIVAARLEPGDIGEDAAAERVAQASAGRGVRLSRPLTGRCNVHATQRGLLVFDAARLSAVNRIDWRVTVGTLPAYALVEPNEMIATVKIIPFAVDDATLQHVGAAAAEPGPLLGVAPLRPHRAGLVLSESPGRAKSLTKRAAQAQGARLSFLGSTIAREERCPHDVASIAAALLRCLSDGLDPVLFLGASAIIDADDTFPAALRSIGGTVDHIGMPVDPGNLLVCGTWQGRTVLGLPGCARSLKPSGYDWVLQRVLADIPLAPEDIMDMGAGGLLVGTDSARPSPRPRTPEPASGIGAIVLAAGQSTRMGARNKLLQSIDGRPMCRAVVDTLSAAGLSPIVVVTGHQAAAVRAVMAGAPVRFAHNPGYAEGMGRSLATGAAEVEQLDAVLVALGDMPDISGAELHALISAFHDSDATIVAPRVDGRRGNPVLFSGEHLPALRACRGDQGARALFQQHAGEVLLVDMETDATLRDIDTPAQLAERQTP